MVKNETTETGDKKKQKKISFREMCNGIIKWQEALKQENKIEHWHH